jgi:hypothetical protein
MTGDCIIWPGSRYSTGYGRVWRDGRMQSAHRAAYQDAYGPIPEGLVLDHLCRVRLCVNPDHLEPVTHRVNILRGVGASARNVVKTHCPRGHAFTTENTYLNPRGFRVCRECHRAADRRYRKERAA